jgi:PAS domain S-box-containing protein
MTDDSLQAHRQSALLRLSTGIAAAHDELEVCRSVVHGLRDDALGYNFIGLFMVDPKTGERVMRASVGWPGDHSSFRVPPGQGLSERPLHDGQLHYTPRCKEVANYISAAPAGGSEVDVPLAIGDAVVGVLVVESKEEDAFGREDFEILSAAAHQAGIAINRVRLLEAERRRTEEQKAVLDTLADLSGQLELSRVLQGVVERTVALLGVTGGELAIFDEDRSELEIVASYNIGSDSMGTRMGLGEGAMGRVAETREALVIPDYRAWSGRSEKYSDTTARGVVVVPLLIGPRLVGTLASVHLEEGREFGAEDLRLLNLFAPQAAIAIENARLYTDAQRQRQYFEAVVENSPVAIVTLDLQGNVTSLNPAFENLFGYTPEEAVGQPLDDLIATPETRAEAGARTDQVLSGEISRGIGRRQRSDGTLLDVEYAGVLVDVGAERAGVVALYHDITELVETRSRAEDASQAKSQFLANMSHELRTPLNHIIGFTELVVDRKFGDLNEAQEDYLTDVLQSSKNLLFLINDILDLSKVEAGKLELVPTDVNLKMLLENSMTMIKEKAMKHDITVSTNMDGIPESITADERKLKQIIYNLLSNAIKFTPDGGKVSLGARMVDSIVRVGQRRGGPKYLQVIENLIEDAELADTDCKKCVEVSVSDSGIGINPEDQELIFTPFEQLDGSVSRKYQGTGLGLSLTKNLVELHGGKIWVESEGEGKGSTFFFVIPV